MNGTKGQQVPRLTWTVPEVAAATGLSERTVRRMVQSGDIEAVRLGGRILVPAAVFERLVSDAPSAAS